MGFLEAFAVRASGIPPFLKEVVASVHLRGRWGFQDHYSVIELDDRRLAVRHRL